MVEVKAINIIAYISENINLQMVLNARMFYNLIQGNFCALVHLVLRRRLEVDSLRFLLQDPVSGAEVPTGSFVGLARSILGPES